MFPREHGAYGQMGMPLVTSFALAGASASALLLAIVVVAGFLAHEPLLVLSGRRGGRAKREGRRRAIAWLATTSTLAATAGLAGAWSMQPETRWSLWLPIVPVVLLGVAILANRERGSVAQVAVALAFPLAAVPVCLAAGAPVTLGAAVAAVFAVLFVGATLAVRAIVVATRGGGNPRAARVIRIVALLFAGAAGLALAAAASAALLPQAATFAAAPGLAVTLWLASLPPSPARLRTVGWTLVASSAAATVILIGAFAGAT